MRLLIPAAILLVGLNGPALLREHAAPWVAGIQGKHVSHSWTHRLGEVSRHQIREVRRVRAREIERQRVESIRRRVRQSAARERRELEREIRFRILQQSRVAEARLRRGTHGPRKGHTNRD